MSAGKGDKPRPIDNMEQYRKNYTHALDKKNCDCEECIKGRVKIHIKLDESLGTIEPEVMDEIINRVIVPTIQGDK